MKLLKRLGIVVTIGIIVIFGSEFGERVAFPGVHSVISTAEARVGRPLTPVSVAGAGRRSVRRCAAGVTC